MDVRALTVTDAGSKEANVYLHPLLSMVEEKKIDPSFVMTHRVPLTEAPEAYAMFTEKKDGCIKVVLDPSGE